MLHANEGERIIAIDPRSRRFGFAVFEGPEQLLDWGIKSFRQGVNAVRIPANIKLRALMDEFLPNVVVITKRNVETGAIARIRETLLREAEQRRVVVHPLSRRDVNGVFLGSNHNKYAIAAAIIKRFPELASRRPRERKTWEPEHSVITIFDAAATGIAYFAEKQKTPAVSITPS